jgi:DNA-binding response OmpR family regulator
MGVRVLLVEDDAVLRMLFSTLLDSEGYLVLEASDGEEALARLTTDPGPIGLMITDLGLPKFGGVELISHARELRPTMKILATSGLGPWNVRQMVTEAGADVFVPKPFSVPEVIEIVRNMNL